MPKIAEEVKPMANSVPGVCRGEICVSVCVRVYIYTVCYSEEAKAIRGKKSMPSVCEKCTHTHTHTHVWGVEGVHAFVCVCVCTCPYEE